MAMAMASSGLIVSKAARGNLQFAIEDVVFAPGK
jgi:hypothetical protein